MLLCLQSHVKFLLDGFFRGCSNLKLQVAKDKSIWRLAQNIHHKSCNIPLSPENINGKGNIVATNIEIAGMRAENMENT